MHETYKAVYYNSMGRYYNATVFLSSITLSIRYTDEQNRINDVYWLAENILSMEQEGLASVLQYKNKDGLIEKLLIRDEEMVTSVKKQFSRYKFAGGWKHHVLGNTRNKIILFLGVVLALIYSGYFWFVPWLGERIAGNISKEWEIEMGEKMHQSIMAQYKIDSQKTPLINDFYKALQYKIDYPVKITVVESKEINAFAVPGGHIVVYTAILDRMQKSGQLAALLSHEASHIQLRHSLRNMFRSMARKMFLMLIIGNETGLAGSLINNADNLKGLEYSRSLETEADNNGIELMQSSDIPVSGMLELMEILQQETKGKEPAVFLNTHPVFKSRITNITKQMSDASELPQQHELLESIFNRLQTSGSSW